MKLLWYLWSRKLAAALGGMAAIVGLLLGMAALYPEVLAENLVYVAIIAIAGLGGYEVWRQSKIDGADDPAADDDGNEDDNTVPDMLDWLGELEGRLANLEER